MKLSLYEQETIINYNEEEKTAEVYTHNKALIHKLDKLSKERPQECRLERVSHEGRAADYIIPKAWVRIKPPRIASEAQKAASRAAIEKAHLASLVSRTGEIEPTTDRLGVITYPQPNNRM